MTPTWVYPQLDPLEASQLYDKLRAGASEPTTRWPSAVPSPTGIVVPDTVLEQVRAAVVAAVGSTDPTAGSVARSDAAEWDRLVGDALHETMGILPADAAREGVWSFLTLVLLPDLAVHRFPDMHRDRMLGRPRNVFRRVWWRREVLGDLTAPDGARPLGEDEYVNIFERSHMSRCRPLARSLARTILEYDDDNRSAFARELTRTVRRLTGPQLLDVLSEDDLQRLVSVQAARLGARVTIPEAGLARLKPPPPEHRQASPSMPIDPRRKRGPAPVMERTPSDAGRVPRTRTFYNETVRDLIADGRLQPGDQLVGRHRGIAHTVIVEAEGSLRHGDTRYSSPSEACRSLTGQPNVSGWGFWTTNGTPIGELRRS